MTDINFDCIILRYCCCIAFNIMVNYLYKQLVTSTSKALLQILPWFGNNQPDFNNAKLVTSTINKVLMSKPPRVVRKITHFLDLFLLTKSTMRKLKARHF